MNNEIGRKITSLTLMTIMVAGGMTFAIPGVMPAAHAASNANLFVSAENSQFDNYMSGPQVIEVVIIDRDINDTDESKGEPDVTVNGKILRMAQAVDGNWYGYFADRDQAQLADSTTNIPGVGLDFGTFCSASSGEDILNFDTDDTSGFAIPTGVTADPRPDDSGINGQGDLDSCTPTGLFESSAEDDSMNVVREAKEINRNVPRDGQIGFDFAIAQESYLWPFVQLYELNPTGNVIVQYNKGGGAQSVTLTFDTVDDFAGLELDRDVYPSSSQVHATITDLWLNIDPTDEDSWTFGTNEDDLSIHYQLFDENGRVKGDRSDNTGNLFDQRRALMCEDNCYLVLDPDAQNTNNSVVTLNDNDDSVLKSGGGDITAAYTETLPAGSQPVTITEQLVNSGIFGTYDESDVSVIQIVDDPQRGVSASIDYNETPQTILVGFDFATITMALADDKWNSGEEIPVVLVDGDMNTNSRADEDLDVFNPDVIIPTLSTGDPFTLGEADNLLDVYVRDSDTSNTDQPFTTVGAIENSIFSVSLDVNNNATLSVDSISQIGTIGNYADSRNVVTIVENTDLMIIDLETTLEELQMSLTNTNATDRGFATNFINYDFRSLDITGTVNIGLISTMQESILTDDSSTPVHNSVVLPLITGGSDTGYELIDEDTIRTIFNSTIFNSGTTPLDTRASQQNIGLLIQFEDHANLSDVADEPIVVDFFSFGFTDDGVQASERIANQIIRIEAEETGVNTSTFNGSLEYIMVNQLNIIESDTFADITPISDIASFIVIEDLTDEDAPRVTYNDLGSDGVVTPISVQEEAPSHSGIVSLNQDSYKVADTVVITLEDIDLNINSDLIDIYTVVHTVILDDDGDPAYNDVVGRDVTSQDDTSHLDRLSFGSQGRLLDVTFDDQPWTNAGGSCEDTLDTNLIDGGLLDTGFTLRETDKNSGTFIGDFQIPSDWCPHINDPPVTVTGLDIEVNYVDYRDASGEIIEVGDSAGVSANTGSVSLDRTVYPVPFGVPENFRTSDDSTPSNRSIFPIHATGIGGSGDFRGIDNESGEFLSNGDLIVHIRVNDPDFDINPSGADTIATDVVHTTNDGNSELTAGPVKISVIRGSDEVVLGYAGGSTAHDGLIDVGDDSNDGDAIREFGPIAEIAPDAGIYELDLTIRYTDGPASNDCPPTVSFTGSNGSGGDSEHDRFEDDPDQVGNYCILQGDILQVEYTDPTDASGDPNTVTDSATFDLRNGVLQADKSVYIIGSDMILTLIEPDLDLDNDSTETFDLDLIEWDSDARTTTMGNRGVDDGAPFDPEPIDFRETGDSTGIFQIVIEIPDALGGEALERGEQIKLEYTDWGPSGSDYVGDEDEDVEVIVFTSNFGATIELDQIVYTWTDKVYITITAPDHNHDTDLVDEIGNDSENPITISTSEGGVELDEYKLVETDTDSGIFTGEVILTGYPSKDADGDGNDNDASGAINGEEDGGPTNGMLPTGDEDGITVSFEFSEDETVVATSLIRWNIGEVQWLEASYPALGAGIVRVIDPDMNLNPEAVDNFDIDVKSDSDSAGIDLTVTETNEATGIFEGTVHFTVTDRSSGHRLRVSEGDTVTADYEDNTLPDPYNETDDLDVKATTFIGTVVPPLERAPASNLRATDSQGNSLDTVSIDQQVQISADLVNGQNKEQQFAYLVQIQDGNGVTVSLAWITGSLTVGQSFSPSLSWIPTEAGAYEVSAFVWESIDTPTALSPPISTTVNVS